MSTNNYSYLDDNVGQVRERIKQAATDSGRNTDDIKLIAAVKYTDTDVINYLHDNLGINDIGENRVQQLLGRYEQLHRDGLNIHFIGTLQPNKVKYIIDKVVMIYSVDSLKLASEIDRQAEKHGIIMDVLIEINSGHEESKSGVAPEDAAALCAEIIKLKNIKLCGFMTMAPICEDSGEYRKYFRETYTLCIDIWSEKLHNIGIPVMSMGMSGSYTEAIAEGATAVRVGRRLFEKPTDTMTETDSTANN